MNMMLTNGHASLNVVCTKYDPDTWPPFAVYKVLAKKAAFRDPPIELTAAIFSISREMKRRFLAQ